MAEISTIARPYAEALFRVAQGGDLKVWSALVSDLAAVAGHPDMQALIANPKITAEQVYSVLTGTIKTPLSGEAQNFVHTLIDNGRLGIMPEIATQFIALKNAREGTAEARISSAFALTDAQVAELVTGLEHKFSIKLKPTVIVDTSLIGGVRVVVGDQVLDSSVRTRLDQMRVALTA